MKGEAIHGAIVGAISGFQLVNLELRFQAIISSLEFAKVERFPKTLEASKPTPFPSTQVAVAFGDKRIFRGSLLGMCRV